MVATEYGNKNCWNVCICTHQTGSAGSEVPDDSQGTLVYLLAKKINLNHSAAAKDKDLAGGNSVTTGDGKRNFYVTLGDVIIVKVNQADNTTEFNAIHDWFKSLTKVGASKVYCFYKNFTDGKYVHLSCNAACTQNTDYMKGFPREFPSEQVEGNLYYFTSIKFKEVLLG